MKNKVIGFLTVFIAVPLACYAHAGFYDRFLEMMDVLYDVLKTIFVSQIMIFLLIRFSWFKITRRIRMKLLLLSKRLSKNWWINMIAAWGLSSFVLTSYWYVFCEGLFILGIIPLFIFWILYMIIVFKKKLRVRLLSGLKAINFYQIASIGQIFGLGVYYFAYLFKWYSPYPYYEYTGFLWDFLGYKIYIWEDGGYILLKGMLELSICMAIPYFVLVFMKALKYLLFSAR